MTGPAQDATREREMPLTPAFLVAAASAFIGVREQGPNRGQMVNRFLAAVGLGPGTPWSAAFVSYVGYWSHYDHAKGKSVWPLPRTANCWELGHFATAAAIAATDPNPGDVFLIWNAAVQRFVHSGIVVQVLAPERRENGAVWHRCVTIEGNTSDPVSGDGDGDAVVRTVRRFYPEVGDRFIRWAALDKRERTGNVDGSPASSAAA